MIRVVPSPVRSTSIVVVENPLHAFEVPVEHLEEVLLSCWLISVKLELLEVVGLLSLAGIFLVLGHERTHELVILLDELLGRSLLDFDLVLDSFLQLHIFKVGFVIHGAIVHVAHLRVRDVFRHQVREVLFLDVSDDAVEGLFLLRLELLVVLLELLLSDSFVLLDERLLLDEPISALAGLALIFFV